MALMRIAVILNPAMQMQIIVFWFAGHAARIGHKVAGCDLKAQRRKAAHDDVADGGAVLGGLALHGVGQIAGKLDGKLLDGTRRWRAPVF